MIKFKEGDRVRLPVATVAKRASFNYSGDPVRYWITMEGVPYNICVRADVLKLVPSRKKAKKK